MVRIIPWKLPEVKGGSIGGYTPASGDSDPDIPVELFDFSNANYTGNMYAEFDSVYCEKDVAKEIVADHFSTSGSFKFTGIEAINLLGAASMSVKIASTTTQGSKLCVTNDFILSLDLITFVPTFVSGNITLTRLESSTNTAQARILSTPETDTTECVFTFYVYNGNGEIIQTDEITVLSGE